MMSDKKNKDLAMLIIGEESKDEDSKDFIDKGDDSDEDIDQEALQMSMKSFISAVHDKDEEKALHKLEKLVYLLSMKEMDNEEDEEEDEY